MKILTSTRHLFTDVYIVAHGGKRRVHRQRDPPSVQGRFFQDQFFFNTARQSALHEVVSAEPDNGRCRRGSLRGLVFHWYCIVNSRPKSHSDSQPTPLRSILLPSSPIFVILSLPLTPFISLLPLYSMAILSLFYPFSLCVSYREIIHKRSLEETRRTRTAFCRRPRPYCICL